MESVWLLIPISVLLVFAIAIAFWWSVRSGQFDDLDSPPIDALADDDQLKKAEEKDIENLGENKSEKV